MDETAAKNTDRELWREREGDYYADSLFVTEGGGIGMNVGGYVIVKPLKEWHGLAAQKQHAHPRTNINECPACHRMFTDGETCWIGGCPMGGDV